MLICASPTYILLGIMGIWLLIDPDYWWQQTERSRKRRGIAVTGKPETWNKDKRFVGLVSIGLAILVVVTALYFDTHMIPR
jgi:hypothetical protein